MLRSIRRRQLQRNQPHDGTLDYVSRHLSGREKLFNRALEASEEGPETFFEHAEAMLKAYPDHPDSYLILLEAARSMDFFAMWVATGRRLVQRWPECSSADRVRELLVEAEQLAAENPTPIELGEQQEWMMWYLSQGRAREVLEMGNKILRRHPDNLPVLNNICLAQKSEFDLKGAIATAQKVLQLSPQNLHALSNLVSLLVLSGEEEEAREVAVRLARCEEDGHQGWLKRAEAFSFLGDDSAVLECHRLCPDESAHLNHLAAVARARQRDWAGAKKLWKRCGDLDKARANLENANLPLARRHSAWAFSIVEWVHTDRLLEIGSEHQLLTRMPQLVGLAPILLDRGHPLAVELVLRLAARIKNPAILEAVKHFASTQRGSDELRLQAVLICRQHGILPAEPVKVLQKGKAQELSLLSWEIHWEDSEKLPKPAEKLRAQGVEAMKARRFRKAEACFKAGLELCPESRALRNNLAGAAFHQGREKQGIEMLRSLSERYPDYVHARITLASLHARDGEFEQARAMIDPVLKSARLNVTEFASLCELQLQMIELEGKPRSSATAWKKLWKELEKQEPDAVYYRPYRCR